MRRRQLDEPANVGGGDEVPGRAHRVRPENPALVEGTLDNRVGRAVLHAQSEGPFRRFELLRLHGAEPGNHIGWPSELWPRQALVQESALGDVWIHFLIKHIARSRVTGARVTGV
jgi:hypothetical protein